MMLLPIVERELRLAARLTATYRNRALAAGVVAATAMAMLLFGSFVQAPSLVGGAMFHILAGLAFLFCALEGVRKTADCLSEEKREGTLGLLFLTDLRGYDIILGKLAAMSLNSVYCLLAILPMLALPLLLGGVTPGEFWRMALVLVNLLFYSLCAGIWVSCRSRSEYQAMGRTLLLIVGWMTIPFLTFTHAVFPVSPAYAFHAAFASAYPGSTAGYWQSLGMTQLVSWTLLIWASLGASRCWREEGNDATHSGWRKRGPSGGDRRKAEWRKQMLEINPAYWLAGRNPGPRWLLSLLFLAAGANSVVYVFKDAGKISFWDINSFLVPVIAVNLVLKSLMAVQACHCLAEARQNNSLEMLLATPLTVNQIIRGQVLALKNMFLVPVIATLAVEIAAPFGGSLITGDGGEIAGQFFAASVFAVFLTGFFLLDAVAVTWAGMWFGLTSKKEGQAIAKTILFVLIIPLASLFLLCFGTPLFLGFPIFWIIWSHRRLQAELHRIAARPHIMSQAEAGWLPVIGSGRL